jgi:uncharacterized repeat protein (TIGR02543 family)
MKGVTMKKIISFILLFLIVNIYNLNTLNAVSVDFVYIGTNQISGTGRVRKLNPNMTLNLEFTGFPQNVNDIKYTFDNFIIAGSRDETIRKLDLNMNQLWSHNVVGQVIRIDYDLNGNSYTADNNGNLTKVNNNGQRVWQVSVQSGVFFIDTDSNGNTYVAGINNNIRKVDTNGTIVWTVNVGAFVNSIRLNRDEDAVYIVRGNLVQKYDSSGTFIWQVSNPNRNFTHITVDYEDNVFATANSFSSVNELWKITSNGSPTIVNTATGGQYERYGRLEVDASGYVYIETGSTNRLIVLDNTYVLDRSYQETVSINAVALPIESLEPDFYDVNLSSNIPDFIDLIYIDVSGTSIGSSINKIIPNDQAFSVTSTVIDITPFSFNFWLDLDTNSIYSTNRTFEIEDPNRNYNLEANFSLNNAISLDLDSNLPSPPDFNLIVQTLENNTNSVITYPIINEQIPFGYTYEVEAPTTGIGFYEFDYWYDNINNEVFTSSAIISFEALENLNLTATYSLPNEYQINLTLESQVGVITFQHGSLNPITGTFISVTIGQGDQWTATGPLNENYQFNLWLDLDNNDVFSNNRQFTVSNTTKNYNLRAIYFELVTINWNTLGGTLIPSQKVILGSSILPPPNPLRPNFVFDSWALPSAPNTPLTFPRIINENTTFQAIWLPTHTLTFNSNGGSSIPIQTIIENNTPTAVTPSRFGYTFDGWFTDNITFNNPFNFNAPFTQNTIIHAKWEFGTERDAEVSLNSFFIDAGLDNPIAQWIIVLALFIFLNVMIFIYKGPFIVTIILNFILTALFIVLGFIPIWITIIIFISLFGFGILMFTGGRS